MTTHEQLDAARRDYFLSLARNEVARELNPSPLTDSRANIRSGRALGLLRTEITCGRMNLANAIETAQLSPELNLDSGEVEWVVDRLLEEYERPASSGS